MSRETVRPGNLLVHWVPGLWRLRRIASGRLQVQSRPYRAEYLSCRELRAGSADFGEAAGVDSAVTEQGSQRFDKGCGDVGKRNCGAAGSGLGFLRASCCGTTIERSTSINEYAI